LTWAVVRRAAPAGELHALEVPASPRREIWFLEPTRAALVLGSAQPVSTVRRDLDGLDVVTRRSGGGAVLLEPGAVLWVDVILPASDPLWVDDVGRAAHWLGAVWADALAACGVAGAVVHEGPMVRTEWSALVCFAGLGPGEVTVGGRKVVGISQRRTRSAARFQCVVLERWEPEAMAALFEPAARPSSVLGDVAVGPGVALAELAAAFPAHLPT
jgi:lipoate-protein ligase A